MASNSHNSDDYPQNTRHCVLIDGDFGRHELFSNIHPYTLNRIDKLNDASTFKKSTEEAMKLMNDASNIHYHIWYNSSSVEVDEYYKALKLMYPQSVWLRSSIKTVADKDNNENSTEKFITVKSEHEYDYIWIIYGIENHYDKLIEQLKYTQYSKANIFSYCWLENLKCGSNRIEYLLDYKIKNLIEDRIKELSTQPMLSESITTNTKSKKKKKKAKKQIQCDVDDCKKVCRGVNGLKDHKLSKHSNTQSVLNEEIAPTTATSMTTIPKWVNKKRRMACDVNNCRQSYPTLQSLQQHQVQRHSIPLRCPFTKECFDSNERYGGMLNLHNHVISQHADSFPKRICPIAGCKNIQCWKDWFTVVEHILKKHTEYVLDGIISNVTEQQQIASEVNTNPIETKPTPNIPSWNIEIPFKCTQYGCGRSYEEEESLKRHEAYEHHIALLCPFGLNCQRSKKKYHGALHLRKHVLLEHAPLYSQPTCFDPECKLEEKKPFSSWKGVLTHILKKHLAAVGIFIESTQLRTKAESKSKTCGYNACVQSFKTRAKFQCHLVTYHHYPLRCPYNSNCNRVNSGEDDGEGYLGLVELERHIKANHSEQYPEPMCFNSECQKERHFPGWNAVVNHILTKHWLDIK